MTSNPDKQAILKERARLLSRLQKSEGFSSEQAIEVLEFKIANESYALESMHIREVYPIKDYTVLPCAPGFIAGLISVRRKVLALIDLRYFFDLPKSEGIIGKKALILGQGDMEFGLLTEEISKISQIPLIEIQPPLPTMTAIRQEFLKGITHDGRIILEAQKLFDHKQLIVNEGP